ncbi:MAG: nucleotidyltransferase domain-containing protein [Thermoplasmataceae archaeon]
MIPDKFRETILIISEKIPSNVKWAVDGSTSLALQGMDIVPHDIDILTDHNGAYRIQDVFKDAAVKPVSHSSTDRYESDFGVFSINGLKVEVMGNLKVFRNGKWSYEQNPHTVKTENIDLGDKVIQVVSISHQRDTGYLGERLEMEGSRDVTDR